MIVRPPAATLAPSTASSTWARSSPTPRPSPSPARSPYLVERFTELALQGIDAFILWPRNDDPATQIERFATQIERFAAEVIPAVREAVAASGSRHTTQLEQLGHSPEESTC